VGATVHEVAGTLREDVFTPFGIPRRSSTQISNDLECVHISERNALQIALGRTSSAHRFARTHFYAHGRFYGRQSPREYPLGAPMTSDFRKVSCCNVSEGRLSLPLHVSFLPRKWLRIACL
jgi:hypothetical protein